MAQDNDLKILHDALVGREIPMDMEFNPEELTFQYAHTPYVDPKVPLYGMPEGENVPDLEVVNEAG